MKIYADEFIQALEVIENISENRINEIVNRLNNDSMIECRKTIVINNYFGYDFLVKQYPHKIDVSDEISSKNKSVEEIGMLIANKVEKYIIEFIEDKIFNSEIVINKIRDVRKAVKVVLDRDVIIEPKSLTACFKIGVGIKERS